ncbi:MAG: OB-fold nucleic acid binding domain-containing protein, partial [Pseudomonadota bacterium]
GPLKRKGIKTLAQVTAEAERGPAVVKLAGSVSGRQERKSARGNRFAFAQLSDPTGLYEITVFSDVLDQARDHLEAGSNVVVTAEATLEADQLKLLARSVAPIDTVATAGEALALKVYVDTAPAVDLVHSLLTRASAEASARSRTNISLCLMPNDSPEEVTLDLGEDFPVNPQIKSALKSLPGVVAVEDV